MVTPVEHPVHRGRVLIVDDDALTLQISKERLEGAGYSVEVRDQAIGTVQWVSENKPEFILLDVMMPAIGGEGLATLLRRNESTRGAGVILHSSKDREELWKLARSTGVLGVIPKTPNDSDFLSSFERLVERHRSR